MTLRREYTDVRDIPFYLCHSAPTRYGVCSIGAGWCTDRFSVKLIYKVCFWKTAFAMGSEYWGLMTQVQLITGSERMAVKVG